MYKLGPLDVSVRGVEGGRGEAVTGAAQPVVGMDSCCGGSTKTLPLQSPYQCLWPWA